MAAVSAPASYLFVPATRPDRVAKATATNADAVIVDLEDAVALDDKAMARDTLAGLTVDRPCYVRVNGRSTPQYDEDVAIVAGLSWVAGVVLPKTESADDVVALVARLPADRAVLALVETARGLTAVDGIAAAGPARLLFGSADYLADLGASPGQDVLLYPRSRLVVASAAAGLAPPVDGPALDLAAPERLREEGLHVKALGFGGKLCIHPAQVEVVNELFRPTPEELAWARRVLDAAATASAGAFVVDGAMIDEPVLRRARRLVAAPAPGE